MLSDYFGDDAGRKPRLVLILVLMEYALWRIIFPFIGLGTGSLNPCFNGICSLTLNMWWWYNKRLKVLILVLMEYALWLKGLGEFDPTKSCLNPCFNGICSLTLKDKDGNAIGISLNPCFNGICSLTANFLKPTKSINYRQKLTIF